MLKSPIHLRVRIPSQGQGRRAAVAGASEHEVLAGWAAAELETALTEHARRARKSKATVMRAALAQYLQDEADYQAVLKSRQRRGRTFSLDQVKQRLGLDA